MALLENYHDSSMIESSTYDTDSKTLTIEFKGGASYEYYNVDEDTYNGLCSAPSTGKYFGSNIKGSYDYTKI